MTLLRRLLADEAGATAIEYGLLAALIAVAMMAAAQGLGVELGNTFNTVKTGIQNKK